MRSSSRRWSEATPRNIVVDAISAGDHGHREKGWLKTVGAARIEHVTIPSAHLPSAMKLALDVEPSQLIMERFLALGMFGLRNVLARMALTQLASWV